MGIDLGDNRATSGLAKGVIDAIAEQKGRRLLSDVHGLAVYEDDGNCDFYHLEGRVTVTADPTTFLNAAVSAFDEVDGLDEDQAAALNLIGLSKSAREPLAEAVLCISAVELLSHESPWTNDQLALLENLKQQATSSTGLPIEQAEEVAKAIGSDSVFKSIRQSIKRTFAEMGMSDADWKAFDDIYDLRSKIFHGKLKRGNQVKHRELAYKARDICARFVAELIKQAHTSKVVKSATD
ncbi:hypothetical protein CWB41_04620 [Methylovirgula ligni]|nr:hypothetical protein CWB41_04620 [Methylovirgula ligni]